MSFPLYDSILTQVKDTPLKASELTEVENNASKLDKEGKKLLYSLIRVHYNRSNNIKSSSPYQPPYGIKFDSADVSGNVDVIIDIDKLPDILKQIVRRFLSIHLERMSQEATLEKNRKNT